MENTGTLELESLEPRTEAARKILDAASELFYREGIRAVGVDAIAEKSGVTKMTLYKHFGSKDRLVAAYLHARDELWRDWVLKSVGERVGGPVVRLMAVFDALGSWLESQNGMRGCAFINASVEIVDPDHPAQEIIASQKRWMHDYLESLVREAGASDTEKLADQLLILLEGATITSVMRSSREPVERSRDAGEVLTRECVEASR